MAFALMYGVIVTAKMNNIDLQAWLADVFAASTASRRHSSTNFYPGNGKPNERLSRQRPPDRRCAPTAEPPAVLTGRTLRATRFFSLTTSLGVSIN